ncbi:hypothetical protein V22_03090 [Calycomorphotria hydatis]|uniref:Uncharacterized protein n=1 Tax=Calycomorphotria hydatis TaxID=2528027 RepID=A0A517T422_9PLAN|nr:hypothetical protein V22_03090 [Calycomorphotria hydatis]
MPITTDATTAKYNNKCHDLYSEARRDNFFESISKKGRPGSGSAHSKFSAAVTTGSAYPGKRLAWCVADTSANGGGG